MQGNRMEVKRLLKQGVDYNTLDEVSLGYC